MKPATIEEVKAEQAIFTDLWNIYKKYFKLLADEEWEMYLKEVDGLFKEKYQGKDKENLFHEMLLTITNQLERNYKKEMPVRY